MTRIGTQSRAPRPPDPQRPRDRSHATLLTARGAIQRVLVVDDDPAVRTALQRLLAAEGLEVVTVGDGAGALAAVQACCPDLVLLDVLMPGPDGFEVCRRLKDDPNTRLTPVVLLTGLAAVEDRVRGIEAGADDFLCKPFERNELLARARSLLRLKTYTDELERVEAVMFMMARSIEGKDPYTEGHCERLAAYASQLARRLGLGEELVTALERGGIIHDIGKIAVPDAVLLKQGELTPTEWRVMRQHPVTGAHICEPIKSFRLVLPIIRHHHEKLDGSGYPDGLRGDAIPLTARILQVVDVYDALTTDRPYKRALTPTQALATLRIEVDRGWWDGDVFDEFGRLVTEAVQASGRATPGSRAW